MFTPPKVSRVMCHMSRVTCHMSHVTCHTSHFFYYLFFFGQSGEAYRWRVCYQRGLPRLVLVSISFTLFFKSADQFDSIVSMEANIGDGRILLELCGSKS